MSSNAASEGPPQKPLFTLWTASRPQNLLLAAAGTVTGALAGGAPMDEARHLLPLAAAAIAGGFGTAGGNLLNDLMDIELDRTAHPERPLASGHLERRTAWVSVLGFFAIAIAASIAFNPLAGLLAIALVGLLLLYETRLKRQGLPGNFAIALAAGALFPLGALIANAEVHAPLILGALAVLAHLGRELLKDAEDAEADASMRRTLAVTRGSRVATNWAAVALILAVSLSPLPVVVLDWHPRYLLFVAPAVILFLLAASTGRRDPRLGQTLAKVAMILALAAFLLGGQI